LSPPDFNQEKIRLELVMKFFQGQQVCGNIFSNSGVWTASRFNRTNPFRVEGVVTHQKLGIFLRKNVIRHGRDAHSFTQAFAKLKHEGLSYRFPPDRPPRR
jgi:hypothetical protein